MSNAKKMPVWGVFVLFLAVVGVFNAAFVIKETEQAMVLRFGKVTRIIQTPGLKFKMPFVDETISYEKRTLMYHAEPMTVILADKDRLIVDAFVTYRITDPLDFYKAVRTERQMNLRLKSIMEKSLRNVMGHETLTTLLSDKRESIMQDVRRSVYLLAKGAPEHAVLENQTPEQLAAANKASEEAQTKAANPEKGKHNADGFGVEVVDVRIMRTDLPQETSDAIYDRMRSDRQKVAEKFRAEGKRESQVIMSEADKTRTIILAEAKKQSETIRGKGDGEATGIFAKAFGQDVEFYEFYRSMEAYGKSISKGDTTMILSPNDKFLKHLKK